jgi:hypothetical protein
LRRMGIGRYKGNMRNRRGSCGYWGVIGKFNERHSKH